MKLNFKSKGRFQATMFREALMKYFEGGNMKGRNVNVALDIENIVEGLSRAWDKAEEHENTR